MFEDVDAWSAVEVADELVASRRRLLAEEAAQFRMVAHWADLHTPDYVAQCTSVVDTVDKLDAPVDRSAPGGAERVVRTGADGTEWIGEFAGAELGALLGVSTRVGEALIADAVNVRHRHPLLWALLAGPTSDVGPEAGPVLVPVWLGRRVAQLCAAAGLAADQAMWVDAQTTPYLPTLPTGRFLRLVEAKIVAADPEAAEARARQAALSRFARAGRVDEHGLRLFVARAAAGEVEHLVAVLDRIAAVLAAQGDTDPVEVRRATALRILANPARALALLLQATQDGVTTPGDPHEPGDPDDDAGEADDPERVRQRVLAGQGGAELVGSAHEPVGWMLDTTGDRLPPQALRSDLTRPGDPGDGGDPDCGAPGTPPGPAAATRPGLFGPDPGVEEGLDPELLATVLDAVRGFDATVFDPVVTFHLHLTDQTLTRADELCDAGPDAGLGVARVRTGHLVHAVAAATARRWLATVAGRTTVRPVLDPAGIAPVDAYEHTPLMREAVSLRHPYEVFPYATTTTVTGGRRSGVDLDHVDPYRPRDRGGPPGQTGLHNTAPLTRFHHRVKTHGGWHLHQQAPGTYWWRTRHGHWLRVDPHGTHHHGRDPALDARWLTSGPTTGAA